MEKAVEPAQISNPKIIDYLDYRKYIKDKLAFISSQDKKKSMRWLAKKAGINSPQLISMIVNGKRNLSKEMASALSYALDLNDEEEEFLILLIDLQDSKVADHKEEILHRIRTQFQGGLFKNLGREDIEYFSKWYYPVIRESVGLPLEKNIGDYLGLSKEEVEDAYEFLIRFGLLKRENGEIKKDDQSVWFGDKLAPLAMIKFHLEMISKSMDEVKVIQPMQHFETLTVSIPKKKIPELKSRIHKFVCEVDTWLEEETSHDQVIQLNVNFYSWLQDQQQ